MQRERTQWPALSLKGEVEQLKRERDRSQSDIAHIWIQFNTGKCAWHHSDVTPVVVGEPCGSAAERGHADPNEQITWCNICPKAGHCIHHTSAACLSVPSWLPLKLPVTFQVVSCTFVCLCSHVSVVSWFVVLAKAQRAAQRAAELLNRAKWAPRAYTSV